MKHLAMILCTTALLAGCATKTAAPPEPAAAMVDPNNPLMAPGYLAMAASSDQFEIQSGQLAQQMSQTMAVRNFGQMLVTDHTRTTAQLAAAAQTAGVAVPPPALMPNHQQMLDQLRAAAGPGFDTAFRDGQTMAHQEALQLHQNYASGGDVPALTAVAAQAVPVIQMHLTQAQSLPVAQAMPMPEAPQPATSVGERG
jgi:putative membrane protein